MSSTPGKLFCFGYGYCCDYLGYTLLAQEGQWTVAGTTRDLEKQVLMRENGIKSYVFDHSKPLDDPQLFFSGVTHLLISTPPSDDGDLTFNMHADDILKIPTLKWVGYLSSTGVYGDKDGEWVDEMTELSPNSKRGSRRAKAEGQWLSLFKSHGVPVHIFRLAGIYGPGRSALDSVRAGYARRISKPGHAFSRIHVEDIVQVLEASMNNPAPGEIYNIADDLAAPSHEVIDYACQLLGMQSMPIIPFEEADMSPMARSFYADNKRVHNDKIKNDLNVSLKHPNYRSGLEACLIVEEEYQLRQISEVSI